MFRDETSSVIHRARKRGEAGSYPKLTKPYTTADINRGMSSRVQGVSSSESLLLRRDSSPLSPQLPLVPPVEERGKHYFISHYTAQPSGNASHGWLSYLGPMLAQSTDVEVVRAAMQAVGLAALANTTGMGQINLKQKARLSYIKALSLVNQDLRGAANRSQRDATVVSVMMLGCFEMITGSGNESLQAWYV